ncbi:hypothetical protein AB4Z46_35110 [Variovorax sp. M-6]|uniref:hypothetical protein n=1 Tax=Variovorax sp. M-6 TaxID=3233041 RepID=UPI003F9C29CB
MKSSLNSLLSVIALLMGCGTALACKPLMVERLSFAESSVDLEPDQVAKLAVFIDRANSTYAKYIEVSIEGTASINVKARPLSEAKRLARLRAANVTRAYKRLQPKNLDLKTASSVFPTDGDYVFLQFHLDYDALKLPDCNPVPIPGFKH